MKIADSVVLSLLMCYNVTVMCLSIGTPKIINFPFVPNGKSIIFRCPKIWAYYSLIIMCINIGTPKNHYCPFVTNGKVVELGVPIFKHFRVFFNTDHAPFVLASQNSIIIPNHNKDNYIK